MPAASAADVRTDIDTALSDSDIVALLERVARDIDREYDAQSGITFEDTEHRSDFEAVLTALRIAEGRDRRAESASTGRTSTEYETAAVDGLRKRVRRLDPGDVYGRSGSVVRRDGRHISTTGDSS